MSWKQIRTLAQRWWAHTTAQRADVVVDTAEAERAYAKLFGLFSPKQLSTAERLEALQVAGMIGAAAFGQSLAAPPEPLTHGEMVELLWWTRKQMAEYVAAAASVGVPWVNDDAGHFDMTDWLSDDLDLPAEAARSLCETAGWPEEQPCRR